MSIELAAPPAELAGRLLAEVPYEQRLTGVNMQCLSGPSVVDLYSVDQAAAFLRSDELEHLKDPVSGASYGYIDPQALVWWLENVFEDDELARALEAEVGRYQHYLAQIEPMHELLVQRLLQCEEAAHAAAS